VLHRLSFTARIFLASALLVAAALTVSAVATYTRGYQIASDAANDSLAHSRAVQQNFQKLRFQQLRLMSQLMASDPAFLSYVAEAAGNGLTGAGQVDVRSITDLLTERQGEIGFDFGMVLDASGVLLARSGSVAARESLGTNPVVASAMQAQGPGSGYWLREGRAYQVAVAPLANRDELLGWLVLGLSVDQTLLQDVKQVSGAELVLLDTGTTNAVVTSTLDPQRLDGLNQSLAKLHPLPTGRFDLDLNGEHWLAYAEPLGAAGTALTLTSFDQAMGGFRAILAVQLLAALIATLLAVALSWWLSLRLARPLKELADAAQSAARGEFNRRFTAEGEGEIAKLTQAFDSLLSDLREKSEIENYMADLAKYQPDAATVDHTPGFGGVATAPESLGGAFLAVRLHDTLDANLVMPDKALMAFNQLLRNLEAPARANGGRLAAAAGSTAFLVFEGAETALAAAGQILQGAASQGQKLAVAAALGQIITGHAEWIGGGGASLLGVPVRQLEELLPDAAPGTLVATAEFVKAMPGVTASAVTGAVSGHTISRLEPPKPAAAGDDGETRVGTQPLAGSGMLSMRTALVPGMLLGGRYEILSELGAGGMAVVYKARDRQLNEVVAIKTIKSEDSRDAVLLDAMKSEIRLARKITHRNVLRIYDFGDASGVPFISMEYVRGMTLRYLLQNRARVPFAAGLRIMRQVCTALMVAHEQAVLHRDIKPENVMLEPSGNAKLMDFGIASPMRRGDGQAAERLVVGTPRYASPEQLLGEPVDERTDIYSCGVMMYYMFTGKLPFNERNMERLLEVKGREEYAAPADLVPGFPEELAAVISACLKANRDKRPQSAEALLKILEDIRV